MANYLQAITAAQFNTATLSSSWQPVFPSGFPLPVKILPVYNGSGVAVDYSLDGTNLHGVWPAGATMIVDIQANHECDPRSGSGTLNGKITQNVWVRTSTNPTYLTIGGLL
jgi:hypothetical protein